MKRVSSEIEVQKLIDAFKKRAGATGIQSNFYGFLNQENQVYILDDTYGIFFLEKCELTKQFIYYFYTNNDGLVKADFILPNSGLYKCEYLVNGAAAESVVLHLNNLGFESYATLRKMSRINTAIDLDVKFDVKTCELTDLGYLRNIFDSKFDNVSERLPSNLEIDEALRNGNISKITDGDKILGFYWSDAKKFVSELRYIFVSEFARGRSIGEVLFQHFLNRSPVVKKNQLWVLDDNIPALKLYEKYGFNFERLYDYIFKVEK